MSRWRPQLYCSISPQLNRYQHSTDSEAVGIRDKSLLSVLFSRGTMTDSPTTASAAQLRQVLVARINYYDRKLVPNSLMFEDAIANFADGWTGAFRPDCNFIQVRTRFACWRIDKLLVKVSVKLTCLA